MTELETLRKQVAVLTMQRNRALRALGPITIVIMQKMSPQKATRLIKQVENEPLALDAYRKHIAEADRELLEKVDSL